MTPNPISILVTGGSGFLGRSMIRALLDPACPIHVGHVTTFDLKPYEGEHDPRLKVVTGDVLDYSVLAAASRGADMVIHSAAVVDWGTRSEEEVYAVNTIGTANVIRACIEHHIPHLVYTSSLDAVYGGKPLVDITDEIPYPENHPNMYCKSKCEAEKMVMAANDGALKTVVLRPSDIYGEGDPYHIGSLVDMARGGFYVRLGDGKAKCQHVYVDNMAHAHILAAKALLEGNSAVCGQPYFITDAPGTNFFRFYDQVVIGAGYRIWPKNLWIPRPLGMFMGAVSEGIATLIKPFRPYNPKLSRFAVEYTCSDFTFSSEKARKDFGYEPKYPEHVAVQRSIEWYRSKYEARSTKDEVKK